MIASCLVGCEFSGHSEPRAESNPSHPGPDQDNERYTARFLMHLAQKHPKEEWKQGPGRMDSPELQRAYPGSRFYFVSSPQPMPRGARVAPGTPSEAQLNKRPRSFLSLCVRFGPEEQLVELRNAADYNSGLAPLRSDEDARVAAAAILSTMDGVYFGPSAIPNSLIQVGKTRGGWTCRLRTKTREGSVVFTGTGKCISVSMRYRGPFPG